MTMQHRRQFIQDMGFSAASLPLLMGLPAFSGASEVTVKQRMIVVFSPNGTIPNDFWPNEVGADFKLKRIMESLQPYQDQMLVLKGICDQIKGDGDSHMRGMSCLLTGIELLPGNIQGGSHTPAGWASGLSVDQEIKNFLQINPKTQTRFGSLEFGVVVPDRADPWTRMVYSGSNQPVAPIDDPYVMFNKLYGKVEDRKSVESVLDRVRNDLRRARALVGKEDRKLLEQHEQFIRDMEARIKRDAEHQLDIPAPVQKAGVKNANENMPDLSRMQIDMLVNSMQNDMARVGSLQYTRSVGQAKMTWLGINEGHHGLSHEPDSDKEAQEKLVKINRWYCEEIAYLAKRLAETPEPDGTGSMLDNTTIVWTNELGKGNSHTLNDIPFVLIGGGLRFKMGRSLQYGRVPHNRLLMAFAHAFGHRVEAFGNANYCGDGPLHDLT